MVAVATVATIIGAGVALVIGLVGAGLVIYNYIVMLVYHIICLYLYISSKVKT